MTDTTFAQLGDYVMVDARVLGPHRYVFAAHSERALQDKKHRCSAVAYGDGVWSSLAEWPWQAVAIEAAWHANERRICVLGRDGELGVAGPAGSIEIKLDPKRPLGPFRGLRSLQDRLIAFGMKREVFASDNLPRWYELMDGLRPLAPVQGKLTIAEQMKLRLSNVGGINSIAADARGRLTAVGMRGEIWVHEDKTWVKADSPTNLMLKDIALTPSGEYFVCGLAGTLLKGAQHAWQTISYRGPQRLDLSSMCWFRDALYIADGHSLHVLREGELTVVSHGTELIVPCARVVTNGEWMLSVAGQEVWETSDGVHWNCILG